jgi:hypothetical protein
MRQISKVRHAFRPWCKLEVFCSQMDLLGLSSPMQCLIFYVLTNVMDPVFSSLYMAHSPSLFLFASLSSSMALYEPLYLVVQGLLATGETLMPPFNRRKSQIHVTVQKKRAKQSKMTKTGFDKYDVFCYLYPINTRRVRQGSCASSTVACSHASIRYFRR